MLRTCADYLFDDEHPSLNWQNNWASLFVYGEATDVLLDSVASHRHEWIANFKHARTNIRNSILTEADRKPIVAIWTGIKEALPNFDQDALLTVV